MSSSTRMLMTGGVAASSTPSRRTQLLSNSSPTSTTSLSSLFEQTSPSLLLPSSSLQPIGEISKRDKLFAAVNRHAAKVVNNKYPNFEGEGLPHFYLDEIIKGPRLGSGFFGVVFEVQNIVLRDENGMVNARVISSGMKQKKHHQRKCLYFVERILCRKNKDEENSWRRSEKLGVDVTSMIEGGDDVEESLGPHEKAEVSERIDARSFMKQHCRRSQHRGNENKALRKWTNCNGDGQARYAIKVLNPAILHDPIKLYYQGVMDINTETRLLSKLQDHPNICKLRAIGKCRNDDDGTSTTFHQDFFIVLDRLYHILDQRLAQWKKQSQRYNSIVGKKVLDRHAKLRKKLWVERLCAAHGLASALAHLHSKNILHRDLKVDNIGFDIRGDVKLFDFGLARELPKDLEDSASCDAAADNNENLGQYLSTGGTHNHRHYAYSSTWKMTGETGTPRYMSPETALNRPYNASCDTYSFCILMWQMLMLKTPFELYSAKAMCDRVWRAPHKRPPLDRAPWSSSIKLLLEQGWGPNLRERPPMERVKEVLRLEIVSCKDEDDDFSRFGQSWDKAERRSTFVFDPKAMDDVADVDDIDSVASCNSFSCTLPATSPLSAKSRHKVTSKDLVETDLSKNDYLSNDRADANARMDGFDMPSSIIHFSPTQQSDGQFPASSPFERTCASAVLPLLGLPIFGGDSETDSSIISEDRSTNCLMDSDGVKGRAELENEVECIIEEAWIIEEIDEKLQKESAILESQGVSITTSKSKVCTNAEVEDELSDKPIDNYEKTSEYFSGEEKGAFHAYEEDEEQWVSKPKKTQQRCHALPLISPSYERQHQSTTIFQAHGSSTPDKEPTESFDKRRELLSAKSETLMIRIKELKMKQKLIRARIASLHDNDVDGTQ